MRRLVMCFDGTWATADKGSKVTNVVKLLRSIANVAQDGASQIVGYEAGVNGVRGGATGAGLDLILVSGYRFLANNYVPGDEIYIFGFSRGAYTARSLAGLLSLAGMLRPGSLGSQLDKVVEIYRSDDTREQKRARVNELGPDIRHADIPITCVGVWDTVGSLGIPGQGFGKLKINEKYEFHDVSLLPNISVALHALAIDEKRAAFPPTLWDLPAGQTPAPGQIVEQVWFAGVHSNVGGSYEEAELSDIALDWMIKRLRAHTSLEFDEACVRDILYPKGRQIQSCIAGKGVESRTLKYSITCSRIYPFLRSINGLLTPTTGLDALYRDNVKQSHSRRNAPAEGHVTVNEAIHVSALERWSLPGVEHDAPEKQESPLRPYRPWNLAAVITESAKDPKKATPVIGWDGEVIPAANVVWPSS